MKKSSIFYKNLARYSTFAVAVAGVSNANGQIVYTDVDPDETHTDTNFELDLDGDGTVDYLLHARAGFNGIQVQQDSSMQQNGIRGLNFGGDYNYPLVLNADDPISAGQTDFIVDQQQTLNWNGCAYTNSQWCGGLEDKYLGLKFYIGTDVHYGWVRLDVPADGSSFTVKDYAYNSTPDGPINAGMLGVEDVNALPTVSVLYPNPVKDTFTVNLAEGFDAAKTKVTVSDMNGKQVLFANYADSFDVSNLEKGVYIITISDGVNSENQKLIKE